MKFLIIIPAHNEEKSIVSCLKSLENQIFQDFDLMVVNDGSTDSTKEMLEEFKRSTKLERFSFVHRSVSEHQPGAKVVNAFNYGLKSKSIEKFDVICKIDADIIFPTSYFEEINALFNSDKKIGIASGLVRVNEKPNVKENIFDFTNKENQWVYENIASKDHVRGPIKAYRKECFEQMNGLKPVLGWDNIDVMLAKMNGWKVSTNKNVWVKHLRPTAQKYQKSIGEKQGEYFYNIGLDFNLTLLSALKLSWKNKSIRQFFQTITSYNKQTHKRVLTDKEIEFIRQLRWEQIRQKIKG